MHRQMENPDIAMEVSVGYEGIMTYGKAMPVSVRIQNKGADLNGTIAINIYHTKLAYNRYEAELELAQGAVKDILIPVTVYSKQEVFTVELLKDGKVICAVNAVPEQIVNPDSMLIGVLSPEPQNLAYMNISMQTDELLRREYTQVIPLTESTFPNDMNQLNSFGMIVVDGFDMTSLSDAQQEMFQSWLEDGHIAIVGGGAQAGTVWPFFSTYTEIQPGRVLSRTDFTPELLNYLGITADTIGQNIMICEGVGGDALVADAAQPIIWRSQAGGGVIYTTAFELGTKPISGWPVMNTFWQRLLLKDNPNLYAQNFSMENDGYNPLGYVPQHIPMENTSGMGALIGTACTLLLAAGLGAYLILKRMDKRQYLWAVLPVITIVCTFVVYFMAMNSNFSQPIALSVTGIRQDAEGNLHYTNAVSVAVAERGEHLLTARDGMLEPNISSHYDYSEEEYENEPSQLNYRYVQGVENGVGINFTSPWDRQTFMMEDTALSTGKIESALWREEDGLHGYVVNHTGVNLSEGVILSRFGYCSVPALGVEERYDFTLLNATFADPQKPVFEDGCMYETLAVGYADTYAMASEYLYQVSHLKEDENISYDDPIKDLKLRLIQEISYTDYNYIKSGYYGTLFHYVAFCDEFPVSPIYLDGEEITRRSNWGAFSAVLEYNGVGNTGIVYHVPGMDEAVRCQVDGEGKPYMDYALTTSGSGYYRLKENPAFVFDLSELGDVDVKRLMLYTETYQRYAHMYLYDGESWIEQKLSEEIEDPGRFIGADGKLYVQFKPDVSADEHSEVYTPTMLLEGRVK